MTQSAVMIRAKITDDFGEGSNATNQSQESTCLTILRNECCIGYWKAGFEKQVTTYHNAGQ